MSYSRLPAFMLGFHGCDRKIAKQVISRPKHLKASSNEYDWLGHGIYFWENDPHRAMQWAQEQAARVDKTGNKFEPAVVGAVIDLGKCLDLLNSESIQLVEQAYGHMKHFREKENLPLPQNENISASPDYLLRKLDCAVINFLHQTIEPEESFDSVRAAFLEGNPIYPGAGFRRKNHIQICVRHSSNIRGYFHVFE